MFYYQLYGLKVQSNIEFPQLLPLQEKDNWGDECEITVELSDTHALAEKHAGIIQKNGNDHVEENYVWFRNQVGDFLIETKGSKSRMLCERFEGVSESEVRPFFMGNCIAVLMSQRKNLVLHGSSLVVGDKTVLVCGASGSGKSTTSMALIDHGARLMADDISVIDVDPADGTSYAYPAFPEQKLCRDAALNRGLDLNKLNYIDEDRDKFSYLRPDIFVNERRKADILIVIRRCQANEADEGFVNGVKILEVCGAEKVNAITDMFFLEWLYGKGFELKPAEMLKCFSLAGQIRVFYVTRVDGCDTRDEIIDRIVEQIKE